MTIHQIVTDFALDIVLASIDDGYSLGQVLLELPEDMRDSLTEADLDYCRHYELNQQYRVSIQKL